MGFIDRVKGLFGIETEEQKRAREEQARNEQWEKSSTISSVIELSRRLSQINSFDNDTRYSRISSYELDRMSLDDLRKLKDSLTRKVGFEKAKQQDYMRRSEALQAAKWTGEKPAGMSDHDFDRWQNDDGR